MVVVTVVVVVGTGGGIVFTVIIVRLVIGDAVMALDAAPAADAVTDTVVGCGVGDFNDLTLLIIHFSCGSCLICCSFCGVNVIVCDTIG